MDSSADVILSFEKKVSDAIRRYDMLNNGDCVIAAVSGGADSMAMLTVFNTLSRITPFNLKVAHVNHGIRGPEADHDEDFVRAYCENLGIPFIVAHYNVPEIALKTGESIEECGRRLRYAFFSETDPKAKIATAHNLNDCEETFLLNLARGSSLHGLTGIPPVRGNIIRPIIECTRTEIESYLSAKNVSYVTDSTNLSDEYSRNRIRHNVIPVLKSLNPDFDSAFLNCTRSIRSDDSELERQARAVLETARTSNGFTADKILSLPEAIRNRALISIFKHYGCREPENRHISIFYETGSVNLPGNITIGIYRGQIIKQSDSVLSGTVTLEKASPEELHGLTVRELSQRGYADKSVMDSVVIRRRMPGDRFLPAGSSFSRSLKNMFSENNVPACRRSNALIIEKDGRILFAEGIGTSAYALPNKNTIETVRIIPDAD